jgi:CheY-like chemotaxis protein
MITAAGTDADAAVPAPEPRAVAMSEIREPASERRAGPLEVSSIEGTRILVVDDDFRNIFALSALLERGHADVFVSESGAEAIAKLQELANVDIVLLDIMMPEMNGYETMAAIRLRPRFADIPIIAVTGKVVGGERQRCLDAGANDYVAKPVETKELLAALRPWLPAHSGAPA